MTSELAFSVPEYDRRLDAVRTAMKRAGLEAMVFFDPTSVAYLSGFTTVNLWDSIALIVFESGEPVTVLGSFELERFKVSSRFATHRLYPPGGDCLDVLSELNGSIGVEDSRYVDRRVAERFQVISGMLDDIRIVKSPEEIAILRRAATITDHAILAGTAQIRPGVMDNEICAHATSTALALGSEFMCIQPIVTVGPRTGIAHSSTARRVIESGDPVFFEIGACLHRYTAPLMRTRFCGEASAEVRELAALSSQTLDAMIATMRAGVPASEVASAGERMLAPALSRIAFHFVWGYPVGLGFPPSWLEESGFFLNAKNDRPLQAGMVFHLPLMLRIPGVHGAGFSETVVVTKEGAEPLSRLPRTL